MRGASRTNIGDNGGRETPRHSSMNVRETMGQTRNKPTGTGGFFMTQNDVGGTTVSVPRTGAKGYRNNKMAPLLSPAQ